MEQKKAILTIDGKTIELPLIEGSEGERALDISKLRQETGLITFDPGYANTGSCKSEITFVDGENGILRYRGYPIEELAEHSSFIETAMLLIFGHLPSQTERAAFREMLSSQELLHEDLLHHFEGFPPYGQPMSILSAVINSFASYHPDLLDIQTEEEFRLAVAKIISKVRTISAFAYRKSLGRPFMYPDPNRSYCSNFLHMMFSVPYKEFEPTRAQIKALSLVLIVHADHEQNCSCSTVRMVGSSQANLFASIAAGICALWGRLHGGANAAVIEMLENISAGRMTVKDYLEKVKRREMRLMGFGHRVYKSFDPRAKILKKAAHKLLHDQDMTGDPLIEIAQELEAAALSDDFFIERKLYPNVDFYSGIILRTLGIPVNMFPVMFAIGRMPGWIAHWYEESRSGQKIHRPRQVYMGPPKRRYVPIEER
ncbi:citrate synthase I [Alkalidesulfovibrio alkalitolerans DSM 16529]|uniref:Citrate synthase n=1 Tax=Alkalidesulfovibrio alkalitolerans DSM 16529 TaxID=1121439 RepID=S7T1V4_9BACT|nr:citrate synthase [Alkalidesulfovibrio alkalitolerans]EPR30495.1 citrate synthase I [Alkalidesulfovibrio alkalitolerans DSM 16529]